ncbi:MAG: YcaO-like family protein [Candidatus Diapherotrites archaeon]
MTEWKPGIKPCFSVFYPEDDEDNALFVSLAASFKFEVKKHFAFDKMMLFLNGNFTVEEIAKDLGMEKEKVEKLVGFLKEREVFSEEMDFDVMWEKIRPFLEKAKKAGSYKRKEILVVGFKETGGFLKKCLEKIGLERVGLVEVQEERLDRKLLAGKIKKPDLVICFLNSTFSEHYRTVNRECLMKGIKAIYAFVDGAVGPTVTSKKQACVECYFKRFEEATYSNINYSVVLRKHETEFGVGEKIFVPLAKTVLGEAMAALKGTPGLTGKIRLFSNEGSEEHPLMKAFPCFCSPKKGIYFPGMKKEIRLKDRVAVDSENGFRIIPPEKTIGKAMDFVGPMGIITSIFEPENSLASSCKRATPFSKWEMARVNSGRLYVSGKGMTPAQKKASALMEGIERYCSLFQGYEKEVFGSYNELRGRAINPAGFLDFKHSQLNYHDDIRLSWTWGYSLTKKQSVLVPTNYTYFFPHEQGRSLPFVGSNGLAAGNCLEEAILQGIFEVFERYCTTVEESNRLCLPDLDIGDCKNRYVLGLVDYLEKNKIEFFVKYFEIGLGIHTIGVFLRKKLGDGHIGVGYAAGTHSNPEVALMRSLSEALQAFPQPPWAYWVLNNRFEHLHCKGKKAVSFWELKDFSDKNLKKNIENCVEWLKKEGAETIVVDLSRPFIPFSVVRVLVPELVNAGNPFNAAIYSGKETERKAKITKGKKLFPAFKCGTSIFKKTRNEV